MASVTVRLDSATPKLRRMAGWFQGRGMGDKFAMRWGARVRKDARETALAKGGRMFWREIARSINLEQRGRAVVVEAAHVAAAQKQYGGPIKAKGKAQGGSDFLTIPIADEAKGQSAAKFALAGYALFAIMSSPDSGVLGYSDENFDFEPLFALKRETAPQRPDPFFPSDSEIADMGEDEAVRMIKQT